MSVEYVAEIDTLAIVTIKETQSASLRTTNAILIAALLIASYFLNMVFIVAVMITKSFRTTVYLMFCHLTLINIIDLSFNILLALIFVANGNWILSNGWCTFNVAVQEFVHLNTLFLFMMTGIELAMGTIFGPDYLTNGHKYISGRNIWMFTFFLFLISCLFGGVVFLDVIPTKPFRNRYICGIDSGGPIGYVIARLIVYCACLVVILITIGTIVKKRTASSIPQNSQEYTEFIRKNRAMQENRSRSKLMICLTCVFILIEGPYISLCFFYESYTSRELVEVSLDIPQDADTLITWLKFLFPLLCPIIMLTWCTDVWLKVKEVICCRSYDPPTLGHYVPGYRGRPMGSVPGVMTIVGTDTGLQLTNHNDGYKMYQNGDSHYPPPSSHEAPARVRSAQTSPILRTNPRSTQNAQPQRGNQTTRTHPDAGGVRKVSRIPRRPAAKNVTVRANPPWKN